MIQDHTIDQCLIELARTMKALKALRAARKASDRRCSNDSCSAQWRPWKQEVGEKCPACGSQMTRCMNPVTEYSAAHRASMDLTRKLADLRQGR